MKQIINGKRYNTETAVLVAEWDNVQPAMTCNQKFQQLYRTKSGKWFRTTQLGRSTNDSTLVPLSPIEARMFLERPSTFTLSPTDSVIEKYFTVTNA